MTNRWLHIIYGSIVAVMALAIWGLVTVCRNGGFADAEKLAVPAGKNVSIYGNAPEKLLSFQGTWRIDDEKTGFPKHSDFYQCNQTEGFCTMSEALLSGNALIVNSERFDIVKWDDQQVILRSGNNCRTNTIVVDLLTQDVQAVFGDTPNRNSTCDKVYPPMKPQISHLMDGMKLTFPDAFKK